MEAEVAGMRGQILEPKDSCLTEDRWWHNGGSQDVQKGIHTIQGMGRNYSLMVEDFRDTKSGA